MVATGGVRRPGPWRDEEHSAEERPFYERGQEDSCPKWKSSSVQLEGHPDIGKSL